MVIASAEKVAHPLVVEDMSFSYGSVPLLRDCSLTLRRGEILAIAGPNGSGKSTLLKLLRGLLAAQSGTVLLEGRAIERWPRRQIARTIAVVAQREAFPFDYSVSQTVAMGRFPHRGFWNSDPEGKRAVASALEWTGLSALAERPLSSLSGGELQKVAIARALAQDTPLLFLDEPLTSLDIAQQVLLMRLLSRLRSRLGKTVALVSHELSLSAAIADRMLLLFPGAQRPVWGRPEEVLTPSHLEQAFGLPLSVSRRPSGALRVEPPDPL
jgi:iron complex transport system ATP-binding protein